MLTVGQHVFFEVHSRFTSLVFHVHRRFTWQVVGQQ